MRRRGRSPLIGLSCGHRVTRPPEPPPLGRGHWCGECGAYRLSGGKSTGEHAFDGFLKLPVLCEGLEVDFRGLALADYQLALLKTLGVTPVNYRPPPSRRRQGKRGRAA